MLQLRTDSQIHKNKYKTKSAGVGAAYTRSSEKNTKFTDIELYMKANIYLEQD